MTLDRSSATDDFLDLEIPTEASTSPSSTVVTITDPWAAAAVTEETTTTTAATSSIATTADTTTATTEQTTASEVREVEAVCRRYNACVVYLASDADTELDIADIRAVAEAGAASRRAGLSVGTAVARLEAGAGAGLPRNTIATLTVEAASLGSLAVPRETHNYDLSAISRAAEDDSLALRSAAAAVAGTAARLGWGGVAVVVQGSGATQQLAELLVLHPGLCVQVYLELYVDISSIYAIYSLYLARDPPGP